MNAINTLKEAASPLLTTQAMPSGSGVCRATIRGRPSGLKGADASRCDRPAGRPLTPETSATPSGQGSRAGQGLPRACPGARHGTPSTTYSQDQESSNYKIEVSTVPGDCRPQRRRRIAGRSGYRRFDVMGDWAGRTEASLRLAHRSPCGDGPSRYNCPGCSTISIPGRTVGRSARCGRAPSRGCRCGHRLQSRWH